MGRTVFLINLGAPSPNLKIGEPLIQLIEMGFRSIQMKPASLRMLESEQGTEHSQKNNKHRRRYIRQIDLVIK